MYEPFKIDFCDRWAVIHTVTLALLYDSKGNIVTFEAEDRAEHQCAHLNLEIELIVLQKQFKATNKLLGSLILKLKERGIDISDNNSIGENN